MSTPASNGKAEEKDDLLSLGFSLCHLYGNQLELPWYTKEIQKMKSNAFNTMKETKEETVIETWVKTKVFPILISNRI